MADKVRTVNVYSLKGEQVGTTQLPEVFRTEFRPDVIKRAVVAIAANRRQPYGPSKVAGMRHSVSTWGKGRGVSRVQRLSQGRMATESPNNVTGRRAHPPVPEKDWSKDVNRKERILARRSAIAATGDAELVRDRGHRFDDGITLPVVFEDSFEGLSKTRDVVDALNSVGVGDDLVRAKEGRRMRAGRGKMRGRRFRTPRSMLIVVSDDSVELVKGAKNLPGVEVTSPTRLNAGVLAPGGDPGRLTVFSKAALEQMGGL